jgi:hypothetical protein
MLYYVTFHQLDSAGGYVIVNITEWATDSYFDLVVRQPPVISKQDYKTILRPDVSLLKAESGLPFQNPKFQNSKFWSPATFQGMQIPNGYKMKWHNFGNGKFQLRLCIALVNNECFVCRAYCKDAQTELREMAKFKIHVAQLMRGHGYTIRGTI